jgi:two-component SAPR family response regulator
MWHTENNMANETAIVSVKMTGNKKIFCKIEINPLLLQPDSHNESSEIKMNKLPVIFLFFALAELAFASGRTDDADYGLIIQAMPSPDAQKTSLVLENNSPIVLGKETSMSFQMLIREEYMFGLVVRMVTNKNENIDLMLTVTETFRHPILVINEFAHAVRQAVVTDEWIPVEITFDKGKNEIVLEYAGQTLNVPHDLGRTSDVRISFGTCSFKSFESTDIASVNIRDVKIFNEGALKRYWKLKEHRQNIVLDSVTQTTAIVTNPLWIVDIHSTWKKIYSGEAPFNTQITFDNQGTFYLVSPDSRTIRVFETKSGSERQIHTRNGFIVSSSPNTIFYDSGNRQLVSYNLRDNSLSRYSFDSNEWSSATGSSTDPFLNNSAVYHSSGKTLYSFGGYEYYKYSHSLIKMNLATGEQKRTDLMEIEPRFAASTAIVGNTMYIFGGRGSKTGKQEIAPHNYYDFYSVDLQMGQTVGLWTIDSISNDFLPGENMIFDAENNCFYVFTTLDGGRLLKIEPNRKGFETMSFPIGENIDALYLYTNLYYDLSQQKLFALIYQQKTKDQTDISIYSLDYPPVSIQSLNQNLSQAIESQFKLGWILILILIAGIAICALLCIRRKKTKAPTNDKITVVPKTKESAQAPEMQYYDFSKSSICLLKRFNVIDKEGNNITEQFSPTLKNLLILLILGSEKDEKGVFGNKMIQLLWPDKTEESAKNSFYVYLNKLRSLLEKTGDTEIINKNGFWLLRLGNDVLCDYIETMHLVTSLKINYFKDAEQTNRLLELFLRGVLLPNTEIDWIDNYKSDFSNLTIDMLTKLVHEDDCMNNELRLKIADTLLLHDVINEDGLYIKCSILFNSGKKGIAKTVYDNFCKEYKSLLGVHYKYSLTDVLSNKK